jgi:hypothetical protein
VEPKLEIGATLRPEVPVADPIVGFETLGGDQALSVIKDGGVDKFVKNTFDPSGERFIAVVGVVIVVVVVVTVVSVGRFFAGTQLMMRIGRVTSLQTFAVLGKRLQDPQLLALALDETVLVLDGGGDRL